MTKALGSVLLIVDDWEALERYEDRLTPISTEVEAVPLSKEGLRRSGAQEWDWVLLDLTSEDLTLEEACRGRLEGSSSRWFLVGSEQELSRLQALGLIRPQDGTMSRPFDWPNLLSKLAVE